MTIFLSFYQLHLFPPFYLHFFLQILRGGHDFNKKCPCREFFFLCLHKEITNKYTFLYHLCYSFIPFNLGHYSEERVEESVIVLLFKPRNVLGVGWERERDHMISPFSSRNNKHHIHIFWLHTKCIVEEISIIC